MELQEYNAQTVGQATVPLPVGWLEGDVLAEYARFLEESAPPLIPAVGGVKWLEGDVLADFLQFLGEGERAIQHSSSRSNGGDDLVEEDSGDDEEMEQLLRHIMSLPAFMARAAAPPVQEFGR